jgi:hypothetical protein
MFDKLTNLLKEAKGILNENGTSYALIIASFIGIFYYNSILIHLGTPGSEFRLSTSLRIPWGVLVGIGLLLYKNWLLKLCGALILFMVISEIAYIIASLSILGKYD